jgi:hypothetical protein
MANDLLKTIKAGTDNVKLLDWPGTDKKIALRILSINELQSASFATERFFSGEKISTNMAQGSVAMVDEYESERVTQVLYKALRDPEHLDQPVAANITEFRSLLTSAERELLGKEYMAFERETSPSPENLTNEELEQVYQDIKKNAQQTIMNVSSISTARKLLTCLVKQLTNLQKDSGSTSSPSQK